MDKSLDKSTENIVNIDSILNDNQHTNKKKNKTIEMKHNEIKINKENNIPNQNQSENIWDEITNEDQQQFHHLLKKQCQTILFDSYKDQWTTPEYLNKSIIGKCNLLFIIITKDNFKIGYFLKSQIQNIDLQKRIKRKAESLHFILNSSQQNSNYSQINSKSSEYCLYSHLYHSKMLITLGPIVLYCDQTQKKSFYQSIETYKFPYQSEMNKKVDFEIKRLIVIEMNDNENEMKSNESNTQKIDIVRNEQLNNHMTVTIDMNE